MTIKCVHTEHCCRVHGCKYGDLGCPVWLGYKTQSYACEDCCWSGADFNLIEVNSIQKPHISEYQLRRKQYEDQASI